MHGVMCVLYSQGLDGGEVITQVQVRLNSFYGQFADCQADGIALQDGNYSCAADWECWCNSDSWGPPPPPSPGPPKSPCLNDDENDDGDPCMCDVWGGCGGGKWGPAIADKSMVSMAPLIQRRPYMQGNCSQKLVFFCWFSYCCHQILPSHRYRNRCCHASSFFGGCTMV